ncbi:MAG: S1C family serine protease [Smithellaceae bacterium]|nr:S1C family serine protease [Smithellaceae bacterium]
MRRIVLVFLGVLFLIGLPVQALADTGAEGMLKAVVRIRSLIPPEAESAGTLGTHREGNGVVIDADGTILTLSYLIREAESIEVSVPGEKPVRGTILGYDFYSGLALVKTHKPLGVAPIELGRSAAVKSWDSLLVAGHGGEEAAQVVRVISRSEFAGYWEYLLEEAIYTLPAYHDFGGAALISPEGKLVGILSLFTQVTIPGVGSLPCNVSIPIDLLHPILASLKNAGRSGRVQRPWLGINAEVSHGRIIITRVTSGGPAEKAGLKPGDMILAVDGKEITGLSDFYRKVWSLGKAGVQVPLSALQGVKIREISVHSIDRHERVRTRPGKEISL